MIAGSILKMKPVFVLFGQASQHTVEYMVVALLQVLYYVLIVKILIFLFFSELF